MALNISLKNQDASDDSSFRFFKGCLSLLFRLAGFTDHTNFASELFTDRSVAELPASSGFSLTLWVKPEYVHSISAQYFSELLLRNPNNALTILLSFIYREVNSESSEK